MAEVYKAQSTVEPNIIVAIKRILPQFSLDKRLIGMLVNEARLSLVLSHPNVVPVLDFGMVDGNYFIAMEYVQGKDLKSIMIRCKTREADLPFAMAIHTIVQVLRGLDYAYNKRDQYDRPLHIVHRDISPQNVMVSMWGEVKVLDFGIAKATTKDGDTQAGILKGKFSYMSPEQARGEDIDHRSDIYSAGVVLWELLTLESCFQAETDLRLLDHVRQGKIRDPSIVNPKVPRELAYLVLRAMNKKPRKRFQRAVEFADALENFQLDRYGAVTDADLAAFVRNLFGISAQEVINTPRAPKDFIRGGIDRALTEPVQPKPAATLPRSWQSISKTSLLSRVSPALLLLVVLGVGGALSWKHSPVKLFRSFDHRIGQLAAAMHSLRSKYSHVEPKTIELYVPAVAEPLYTLQFSPDARGRLDDLPFETFERIRDRATDLGFDPHPHIAAVEPRRPGTWWVAQSGWRIRYHVDTQLRTVTVEEITRAN